MKTNMSYTYLGHIINNNLNDNKDTERQLRNFYGKSNMLLRTFGSCSYAFWFFDITNSFHALPHLTTWLYSAPLRSLWGQSGLMSQGLHKTASFQKEAMRTQEALWFFIKWNYMQGSAFVFEKAKCLNPQVGKSLLL